MLEEQLYPFFLFVCFAVFFKQIIAVAQVSAKLTM